MRDKTVNSKYDGYQRDHASRIHKCFNKKSFGANTSNGAVKSQIMLNQQLNEEFRKPIIAERSIKTLKNKIYKYMTLVSGTVYINKLDDIVNKYNNKYQSTIKVTPADVKSSKNMDFSLESNDKGPKFKIGFHVRISKYKIIFAKGYVPN